MGEVPRVSIGLPVYNGENFLSEALDALLAQTFTDFELIISDNASTDATAEICRRYAEADPRIRYFRQEQNIGGGPNMDFVFQQSRAPLFKWGAHDDLYGKELIERCVEVLDREPDVVLCHADMAYVDERGEVLHRYDYTMNTGSRSPTTRFASLLDTDGGDDEYGVIRSSVLHQVKPCDSYYNPGRPFVAEIALHGPFRQVPDLLYFRRDHPARGDRSATVKELCSRMDPKRAGQSTARLYAEYVLGYFGAIRRAPVSLKDRAACSLLVLRWLGSRGASTLRGLLRR